MKFIIFESPDRCGKSTLIENICKYYNYDNITIRHFGKPPLILKPHEILNYQFKMFRKELNLYHYLREDEESYYPNILLWNRSHLGEYIYAQMFRNANSKEVKERLLNFERSFTHWPAYLITLVANPEFLIEKDDGYSFSKTIEEKSQEVKLFQEAHNFSTIQNKLLIKVDMVNENNVNVFRPKEDILSEVLDFIK